MAVPSIASAATFRGETAQGLDTVVRVAEDRLVNRIGIKWKGGCRRPRNEFDAKTVFGPTFDKLTETSVAERGSYRGKEKGTDFTFRVKARMTGERVSDDRWRGKFKARARVFQDGEPYDRCSVRRIGWSATAV
jgi:hypothetical protein